MPDVINYREQPLGSLPGEAHLQAPYNNSSPEAIVRVRNTSDVRKRRVVVEANSFAHVSERSIRDQKSPFRGRSEEAVMRQGLTRNVNWEEDRVEPIIAVLKFNGKRYVIQPGEEKIVEEGMWDLYCGNYNRMNSRDIREATDEMQRVNERGLSKWVVGTNNPYGYLEFTREPITVEAAVLDREHMPAGPMMEI